MEWALGGATDSDCIGRMARGSPEANPEVQFFDGELVAVASRFVRVLAGVLLHLLCSADILKKPFVVP